MKGKIQANTKALYSTEDENAHLDTKIDGMRINMSVAGDNTAVILEKIKQDYARQCNVKKIMTGVGKTISSRTQDVVIKEKRRVLLSPEKLPGTKRARTFREFGQDTELRTCIVLRNNLLIQISQRQPAPALGHKTISFHDGDDVFSCPTSVSTHNPKISSISSVDQQGRNASNPSHESLNPAKSGTELTSCARSIASVEVDEEDFPDLLGELENGPKRGTSLETAMHAVKETPN
ncbi:hypothetical protein B0J14DRAFT_569183 [Halenospora varia]|nr:hypothetical protein B0J14DRAFT_569183 [Halenospora varia]